MSAESPASSSSLSSVGEEAQTPAPHDPGQGSAHEERPLPDAARRALAEAAERRATIDARAAEISAQREKDGRGGLEPVRYGDWEVKGLASDF